MSIIQEMTERRSYCNAVTFMLSSISIELARKYVMKKKLISIITVEGSVRLLAVG